MILMNSKYKIFSLHLKQKPIYTLNCINTIERQLTHVADLSLECCRTLTEEAVVCVHTGASVHTGVHVVGTQAIVKGHYKHIHCTEDTACQVLTGVIAHRHEIEKCTHRSDILTVTILLIKRYSGDEQNWSVLESVKSEMRSPSNAF